MGYSKIEVATLLGGSGLHIILNAPKGNVLDASMMKEIHAELEACKARRELKLIVFSGAGGHFSFGASVAEHVREQAAAMISSFHALFLRMVDLAVPTAAAVQGRCLGGGMELAMFCNRVFAHPGSVFGQPEIQLGVLPPVASLVLPFKVGQSAADEINLTGRNMTCDEAWRLGLVDQVSADPLAALEAWADQEIAPKSASSLRFAVRASRFRLNEVLRTGLPAMERLYIDELMSTHDANEGIGAFLEKRKPSWLHT